MTRAEAIAAFPALLLLGYAALALLEAWTR